MASGMTKTQLVRHMAEKVGTNNKTAAQFLEHLADTAIKETKKKRRVRDSWPGPLGKVQPQGPHGSQPPDR